MRPHQNAALHHSSREVHHVFMRMSVTLDPDVYEFTAAYAGAKRITLSAAISELIRRAEQAPESVSVSPRLVRDEHGYLVIAATGHALTPEMVKELSEDPLSDDFSGL